MWINMISMRFLNIFEYFEKIEYDWKYYFDNEI